MEAFTITELESTSFKKRRALVQSSVIILSVCCELYSEICAIASSKSFTMRMDKIGARYSVSQSSSVAALILFNKAFVELQPRSSTPAAWYFSASGGKTCAEMPSATSSVSIVLQVP